MAANTSMNIEYKQFFEGKGLPFEGEAEYQALDISNQDGRFRLKTSDGWEAVYWGDYILKFPKGVFMVIKAEQFEELIKNGTELIL